MGTYTIALATRLKRKVFRAGNIPGDVLEMISTVLRQNDASLGGYRFYDYGVVLCVECGGPRPGTGCAGRGIIAAFEDPGRSGRNIRSYGRCLPCGTSLPVLSKGTWTPTICRR